MRLLRLSTCSLFLAEEENCFKLCCWKELCSESHCKWSLPKLTASQKTGGRGGLRLVINTLLEKKNFRNVEIRILKITVIELFQLTSHPVMIMMMMII